MARQPEQPPWILIANLLVTVFLFACALSLVLTIGLFGNRVLINGFRMGLLGFQAHRPQVLMHPPCSCALAEILILVLAVPALVHLTPRLIRQVTEGRRFIREKLRRKCR